jgi:hypothetical protein
LFLLPVIGFSQKSLRYEDFVYEDQVRTVLLYQAGPTNNSFRPAAAPLRQQQLVLEFDDIQESFNNYYVRFVHCTYDWKPSRLPDLEFLTDFNEFPINQYSFSNNTHLPYVHYVIPLPPVKIASNYLLMVYRDGNKDDLIITKRVLIYENRISVSPLSNFAGAGTLQEDRQALNFVVNYGNLQVINPTDMVRVVIRQNQRWDNALINPSATFVRDNRSEIEYRVFDDANSFLAGNEFRFVDFRSLVAPGQNVQRVNRAVKPYELYVMTDGTRQGLAYAQYRDLNGQFFIDNLDFPEPMTSANYAFVNFYLKSPRLPNDVYVMGHFNQFSRTEENKLVYNRSVDGYEARLVLKQGLYNYCFVQDGADPNQIEGNHFETENTYEALVYYRSLKPFADLLLGYATWTLNPR